MTRYERRCEASQAKRSKIKESFKTLNARSPYDVPVISSLQRSRGTRPEEQSKSDSHHYLPEVYNSSITMVEHHVPRPYQTTSIRPKQIHLYRFALLFPTSHQRSKRAHHSLFLVVHVLLHLFEEFVQFFGPSTCIIPYRKLLMSLGHFIPCLELTLLLHRKAGQRFGCQTGFVGNVFDGPEECQLAYSVQTKGKRGLTACSTPSRR